MSIKTDTSRYVEAVGRRKEAVARVRLFPASKESFVINDKSIEEYFPVKDLQLTVQDPITKAGIAQKFAVSVKVKGGGVASQAEAVRHGIARVIVEIDPEQRITQKRAGFLKRDPRVKERKKFGLKKARRAPQWSKR